MPALITKTSAQHEPKRRSLVTPRQYPSANEAVLAAASWLIEHREQLQKSGRRLIPVLREEFELTARQAIEMLGHVAAADGRDWSAR